MFEAYIACKYLIPRKRSFAASLISLLSIFVISLVVWLVLVFLSVTTGMEKNWIDKLVSVNAPLRITPTPHYYTSYYYRIDSIASSSDYSYKTLGEKAQSPSSDPYNSSVDGEIPSSWPKAQYLSSGKFLDPVKESFQTLEELQREFPSLSFQDYEIGGALLRLHLFRKEKSSNLSQMSYLLSINEKNPNFSSLLLPSSNPQPKRNDSETVGVFLPKASLDTGVLEGDKGYLIYSGLTGVSTQEQRIPIRVQGFYDPGIFPVGNRAILVPKEVIRTINTCAPSLSPDGSASNGIYLWVADLSLVEKVQKRLQEEFIKRGIASYWTITTFKDYEFSKDLMEQFQSDRTLFTLISIIILIVACSNIISLLVLLVNDKKKEIAVLQAMGASSFSIASIFGLCGVIMGAVSSLVGVGAAVLTLRHLDILVHFLSSIQGHAAFHVAFFGEKLPNQLSMEALTFVLIATPLISLASGLIPAIKASRFKPSALLRTE